MKINDKIPKKLSEKLRGLADKIDDTGAQGDLRYVADLLEAIQGNRMSYSVFLDDETLNALKAKTKGVIFRYPDGATVSVRHAEKPENMAHAITLDVVESGEIVISIKPMEGQDEKADL